MQIPPSKLSDSDIRKSFSYLSAVSVKVVSTYPSSSADKGMRGDLAFKSDGTKLAIHTGSQWKSISLSDTL